MDEAVRDRFIIGMASDERLFEKFCEESDTLTLASTLNKALIHEVKWKGKVMSTEVNFIKGKGNHSDQAQANNGNRGKREPCKHCG